jgi:hypothetical protein
VTLERLSNRPRFAREYSLDLITWLVEPIPLTARAHVVGYDASIESELLRNQASTRRARSSSVNTHRRLHEPRTMSITSPATTTATASTTDRTAPLTAARAKRTVALIGAGVPGPAITDEQHAPSASPPRTAGAASTFAGRDHVGQKVWAIGAATRWSPKILPVAT